MYQGYVMRITGGADKEGFPMKQGVLTPGRVRLLLNERSGCFHALRKGERRRKSVRGCIVDQNLSVINLIIIKKGMGIVAFCLLCAINSVSISFLKCT